MSEPTKAPSKVVPARHMWRTLGDRPDALRERVSILLQRLYNQCDISRDTYGGFSVDKLVAAGVRDQSDILAIARAMRDGITGMITLPITHLQVRLDAREAWVITGQGAEFLVFAKP